MSGRAQVNAQFGIPAPIFQGKRKRETVICIPEVEKNECPTWGKHRTRDEGTENGHRESSAMEMSAYTSQPDVKADGPVSQNGDATEITISLSQPGKRMSPIDNSYLYRLRERKFLLEDKRRLCAAALGIALLGIALMILHAELCPIGYQPGSIYAICINGLISLSTFCLLILIIAYHCKDIRSLPNDKLSVNFAPKLFIIDFNEADWRIAMTTSRVLGICLELLVCAIHPVGNYFVFNKNLHMPMSNTSWTPLCLEDTSMKQWLDLELLLSGLMFVRLYLLHRVIMLHSKVLLSASYRSIGSLNNINFSFRFVLKVLMNKYPGRTLLVFIIFFWFSVAWMLTLCERQNKEAVTGAMGTALWLTAITFLTVGYGDVSPCTHCGRVVCLLTGFMGLACTAMLVAILTKKLALNKGEEHVHFFMLDIQITKEIQNAAANVLRECWLLHRAIKAKKNGQHRTHQRRLYEAIRIFRYLRLKKRKLRDYTSEIVDTSKMQIIICDLSNNLNNSLRELRQWMLSIEKKLDEVSQCSEHHTLHRRTRQDRSPV